MGKRHERQLRSSHLRSHGPLTLQLNLVPVEGLLSAVLQIRAVMVLRESVLHERGNVYQSKLTQRTTGGDTHRTAELRTAMWALANDAQGCRVALSVGANLGLAALLGSHEEMS